MFNIFGGITRCDEVARGIVAALEEVKTDVPMVARLVGTNEAEGRKILAAAHMQTASTLAEAAQKAVALVKGEAGVIKLPPVEIKPLKVKRAATKKPARRRRNLSRRSRPSRNRFAQEARR